MHEQSSPERKMQTPMTRREFLGCAQIGAFALLLIAFGIILIQFVLGRPKWIDLSSLDELRGKEPVSRTITLKDGSSLSVWVVYAQDRWLVFDARVPFGQGCFVQWRPETGRFEDPCSAAKFSLSGEFVDPYHGFAGKTVQDLDRYPASVRDGHLYIDRNYVIHASPFVAPGFVAQFPATE
jgi:hypothetical protein